MSAIHTYDFLFVIHCRWCLLLMNMKATYIQHDIIYPNTSYKAKGILPVLPLNKKQIRSQFSVLLKLTPLWSPGIFNVLPTYFNSKST